MSAADRLGSCKSAGINLKQSIRKVGSGGQVSTKFRSSGRVRSKVRSGGHGGSKIRSSGQVGSRSRGRVRSKFRSRRQNHGTQAAVRGT